MATLPTADEAFPLKSADEAFPIAVEQQRYRQQTLGTSPIQDLIFGDTSVNPVARVLDAFGQGAKQAWGASQAESISKETADALKVNKQFDAWNEGQNSIVKAANDALFRPAAMRLMQEVRDAEALYHGLGAGLAGAQAGAAQIGAELGQPQLGQEVAALPEAFPVGFRAAAGIPHAAPHPILAEIQRAKDLGVIGEGEAGYFGTKPSEPAVPISGPQEARRPTGMPVDLFTETKPEAAAKPAEAAPAPPVEAAAPATPESTPVAAEAPPAAQPKPVNPIAEDVAGKLIAAGRPEAEARASADLIASHYEARAERFGGQRGTAEEMYAAEGADILPGGGVAPTRSAPIKPNESPPEGDVASPAPSPQPPLVGGAAEPITTIPELKKVLRGRAGADPQTWSLFEFLAKEGGLAPTADLQHIFGGKNPFVPGFGPLLRKGGLTMDEALTRAKENSYVLDPNDIQHSPGAENKGELTKSVNDLQDMVSEESRGRKQFRNTYAQPAAKINLDQEHGAIVDELHRQVRETGGDVKDIDPAIEDRVVELIQSGKSGDVMDAFEKAQMEMEYYQKEGGGGVFEPGADGKPQAIIPGTEASAKQLAAARGETLKSKVAQKEPGGLFDRPENKGQGELFQAAYHGSPYDFEVFDTGKIGTGEGAQAYGHGLYFAENEKVAKGYRDQLANAEWQVNGKWLDELSPEHRALAEKYIATRDPNALMGTPLQNAILDKAPRGNLYRVNIKPEPHEFLNWDKPITDKTMLDKIMAAANEIKPGWYDRLMGQGKDLAKWALTESDTLKNGESIYGALRRGLGSDRAASEALSKAGIPGIRYLDQGSRALRDVGEVRREIERVQATLERDPNNKTARELLSTYQAQLADAEKGTHNYVVFDPKNIEITDKNGKPVSRKEFELDQIKRGKINFRGDQKPVITLFKESNASTFIHETGHQWLEELMKDAEHPQAPADLKVDAVKVLDWLGVKDAADIKTSHHEKFARGFERYMMEGKAPSQALARVFDHFREWLTRIYQTVTRLKSPINDEIRGVFDRLLTMHPSEVKIEPEGPPKTFADIHEADAEHTPPEMAHPAAETIQGERDIVAARHTLPEDQNARLKNTPDQAIRSEAGNPKSASDANAPGSIGREAGNAEASGALGAGGIETAPESPGTPKVHRTEPPVTAHDPFPDKAGNIRLDNLNTPEDLNQVIRQTAEDNGDFQNVRGPVSDAQVLDLAEAAGVDAAFIDARKIGEAWTAPQIVALRRLLIQSAQSVHDLAIKAAAGKEADVMAYAQAKARHQLIQERVSSVTAEAGRALRAFQSKFTEGVAGDVNAFLKDATGKTLFQLQKEAAFLSKLQTAQQTSKFVADTSKGTFRSAILEYYINALISGPVTHTRYVVSNAVNALWTPLFEIPAGAISGAIRVAAKGSEVDRVRFGEAGAQLYGMVKGSRDGLSAAIEAFKTGVSPALPTEKMSPHFAEASQAIPGLIGQIVRIPSRSVAGIHSFFKALRYEQNVQALAYREAANEGLRGDAFSNRVAELTTNPTEAMMTDARTNALKELYMAPVDYHSSLGSLIRATNSPTILGTAGKIVVPFMKIGSQITRNAFIERTPLGILDKKVRANLSGEAGGAAVDFQVGKIAAGVALMGATVGLMAEGMATGDGPEEPAKRAVWLLTHTPASIQIGDINFKYGNTGPLGMLMRFVANTYETAEHMGDKDMATLAVSFFEGFAKSVLDETFLRGVKDMLDAMFHPKEYGGRYLKSQITNWIPWSIGLSQVARKVDPFQRETHGIWQAAQAKIPYLSESLMPRRDMFGEPIPNGGPIPSYANDPVVKAMDDLHIGVGKLGKKIRGIDTTEQQYDDLARIAGRMAKVRLNAMVDIIGNPAFPPEKRIEMIHTAISQSRETARSLIIMQNPDIMQKAYDAKIKKFAN